MKELKTEFQFTSGELAGYLFTQKHMSHKAYVYEVKCSQTGLIHYEVFERVENKLHGTVSFPSSKAFGVWAWTFRDYNKALQRFNELSVVEA